MSLNIPLPRFLRPPFTLDTRQGRIYRHLYLDMMWMGVLSGTIGSFLLVFATRSGADAGQIGWLNGAPALVNLLVAIPAGRLMRQQRFSRVAFWSSFWGRILYLPMALLPFFFAPQGQVMGLLALSFAMSLPLTFLNVSFSALITEQVPAAHRGYVMGVRNALLAITSFVFALGSGQFLTLVPFPLGYQIVFLVGFLGAMMSSLHLWHLRDASAPASTTQIEGGGEETILVEVVSPGERNKYFRILGLLFYFHIAQWLVIPVNPLFAVRQLHLSDFQISVGSSMFSLVTVLFTVQATRLIAAHGNHKTAGWSMVGLASFPILMSFAREFWLYLAASIVGAFSWVVLAIALINYLYDNTPGTNRAKYLSYYIMASNAAILLGSLGGPFIAGQIGYAPALFLFGVLRLLAGVAVLLIG